MDKIGILPEETIKKNINSFDPLKTYVKDTYIDMYDVNTWRVGIITKREDDHIEVHFEGWPEKYDVAKVKVTEFRVAPFRRYTKGYTGDVKSTHRTFEYSQEVKKVMEEKVKELLANSFNVKDGYEFTQFFRGELFFYVDALLTSLSASPSNPESVLNPKFIPEILTFLELCLQVIVEWLKISFDLKEELEAAEKWDTLYAVHGRTAVAMSYIELAETLCKLFGGSIRSLTSFLILYINRTGSTSDEPRNTNKATEYLAQFFYNKFTELGGMEVILKLIKYLL